MNWKTIILGVLTIISATILAWIAKSTFNNADLIWWKIAVYNAIFLLILLGFLGLFLFLSQKEWLAVLVSFLTAGLMLYFLPTNYITLAAAFILFSTTIYAYFQIQHDRKNRLRVALDQSLGSGLKTIFFGLAIFLSVIFFYSPYAHLYDRGIKIPADYQIKLLSQVMPGFSGHLTVDEMIGLFVAQGQGVSDWRQYMQENIAKLAPSDLDNLRQQYLKQLGLEELNLQGNERIADQPEIIDKLLMSKIQGQIEKFLPYFPYILAATVFELILFIGYLLVPLAIFLAFALYQLMIGLGLIKIKGVPAQQEVIEL